jgi:hypothetical protein
LPAGDTSEPESASLRNYFEIAWLTCFLAMIGALWVRPSKLKMRCAKRPTFDAPTRRPRRRNRYDSAANAAPLVPRRTDVGLGLSPFRYPSLVGMDSRSGARYVGEQQRSQQDKAAAQRKVASKEAETEKARADAKIQETRQKGARKS